MVPRQSASSNTKIQAVVRLKAHHERSGIVAGNATDWWNDQPASLVDEAPFVANADRSQPIREFAKTVVLRPDDYLSGFVDETPLSIL